MDTAETMRPLDLSRFGHLSAQPFDPVRYGKLKADSYNRSDGDLTGMDCKKCRNKGRIAHPKEDGGLGFEECSCMQPRRCLWKMEKSGLRNIIREMTFERYEAHEAWQERLKTNAMAYANKPDGWLLFCGQPGSGKTHLCTAVCRHRLLQGDEVRYMPWRDEITRLKALSLDAPQRENLMQELKSARILYIDDLFKAGRTPDGAAAPTGADIGIAFELINYRYINHLTTIVSTEHNPQELLEIDEATASRIMERAGANIYHISRQEARNYRLRGLSQL